MQLPHLDLRKSSDKGKMHRYWPQCDKDKFQQHPKTVMSQVTLKETMGRKASLTELQVTERQDKEQGFF